MKPLNLDKLLELTKELAIEKKETNNPGTKAYTSHDIKVAEWRGGVTEALETLKDGQDKIEIKIDKMNSKLTTVRIKGAVIGGSAGFLASAIGYFLLKAILG